MTLEDALADIEGRFIIGPEGDTAIAANGELFLTITCQGICESGMMVENWQLTALRAIHIWHDQVLNIAFTKPWSALPGCSILRPVNTMYWRKKPQIKLHRRKYNIRSRLIFGWSTP